MTGFLIVGVAGVALVLLSLLLGDILDGVFDGLGDFFSTEVIGTFIGALGFVGAIALSLTGSTALALVLGAAAGVGLSWLAWTGSRRLRQGDHTGSVRTSDLVERTGTVLADIPADGFGVITLSVGGHLTRVNAKSEAPIGSGTEVVVVAVLSPTAVSVVPLFMS